ncbi:hypothetical protein [Catellatospora paridis]|uniref:hypothetical protein n=1 Tax=Catellatospora paridis TaxID=1617086 RepID=UPI0012D3FF70|nr:hypothetical protein [Catellatospora paridis]
MTAASTLILVVEPSVMAILVWLFFGFGLVGTEAGRRALVDEKARARIGPFLRQLRRGNVDGYVWLLRTLADVEGLPRWSRRRGRITLDAIAADEQLMNGLLVHCRRRQISVAAFADRLGRWGAGVLVPPLASLHPDGRVREAAVVAMARRLRTAHVPFLIERAVDWVPEVRTAAHAVLKAELGQHPGLLPHARVAYARVSRRKHAPAVARLLGL